MTELWSDDDLDSALDALHSDVPTDERALTEARAGLLAAAGQPGEGNPMTSTDEKPAVSPADPPEPHRHRTRWLAAAAVVAVLAAGGIVAGQILGGNSDAPVAPLTTSAGGVLIRAAAKVAPEQSLRDGQYRYVDQHDWDQSTHILNDDTSLSWLEEDRDETWIPADHTKTWQRRDSATGKYKWIDGSDEEAKQLGVPLPKPHSQVAKAECGNFNPEPGIDLCTWRGWEHPTPEWMADLPRDPKQLLQRLRAETDGPDEATGDALDWYALETATQTLSSGLLPADLRASLYKAIALMPAIKVTERQVDLDGRQGTSFGIEHDNESREIIVNLDTGDFLGHRIVTTSGPDKGTVRSYSSVYTAVVDEMGQRPSN